MAAPELFSPNNILKVDMLLGTRHRFNVNTTVVRLSRVSARDHSH